MKAPIRVRMTVWYVVLLGVIIASVGAFLIVRLRADLTGATDRALSPALEQIRAGYRVEGVAEFQDKSASVLTGERPAAQILSVSGRVVATSGDGLARRPMLDPGRLAQVVAGHRVLETRSLGPGPSFRVTAAAVQRGQRQIVVAAVSLGPVDRSVDRVLVLFALALPVAVAATAAGGWWLARRALRPIDRMVGTAEAIGPSDLGTRLAVPATGDEVAHLARALNTMLDRVHHSVAEQRRLLADTSHELRTPLAVIRTDIDVSLRSDDLPPAAREILESNREEVNGMIAALEDLLTLARADDHRLVVDRRRVDLGELTRKLAQRLGPLARSREVTLVTDGPQAVVWGDPEQTEHALRNLIDNAIKFGPRGGQVTLRTWRGDKEAGVTVEDDGPGIPEELRERVFDRFSRSDESRDRAMGGSGLGLAIVRELLLAQGGRVAVTARDPRGCAFTLTLPLA
jgi:two-component system OmpR family sensor kinase